MKPVSRYPPQNISNPFAQLHQQQHPSHQASHLQHPNPSLQSHGFGSHHPFSAANQSSIFGPTGTNGSNSASAGLHAAFITGGTAGQSHMGFGHGAASLQQQLQHAHEAGGNVALSRQASRIREVWKGNLAEEMAVLRMLVDKYPYISMDTEFPGVVARPIAEDFGSKSAFHYQTMRCNVDLLKLIQLGVTLFTADGEVPPPNALDHIPRNQLPTNWTQCPSTWSFNFKFALDEDMYNEGSIQLLKNAGADFDKHKTQGIEVEDFGSLLITSGLTFSPDVHWISFHGGYDFGYFFKVMWNRGLPQDEEHYRRLLKKFFPNLYDVKFILQHARKLRDRGTVTAQFAQQLERFGQKPGLQDICDDVGLVRIGINHTAGSDAWLTGQLFFEVRRALFDGTIPDEFNGQMWGLTGIGPPASATAQAAALALHQTQAAAAAANGMNMATGSYHPASAHHRDGGPSTPTTNPAGLASTPSQGFSNAITPGAGGAFGNFQADLNSRFALQQRRQTEEWQLREQKERQHTQLVTQQPAPKATKYFNPPHHQRFPSEYSGQRAPFQRAPFQRAPFQRAPFQRAPFQRAPFSPHFSMYQNTQNRLLPSLHASYNFRLDPRAVSRGSAFHPPPSMGGHYPSFPFPSLPSFRNLGPPLSPFTSLPSFRNLGPPPEYHGIKKGTHERGRVGKKRQQHGQSQYCPVVPRRNNESTNSARVPNEGDNAANPELAQALNQSSRSRYFDSGHLGSSSRNYLVMTDELAHSPWSTISLLGRPLSPSSTLSSPVLSNDELTPSDSISVRGRKRITGMLTSLMPRRTSALRHLSIDLPSPTGTEQRENSQCPSGCHFQLSKSEPGELGRPKLFCT